MDNSIMILSQVIFKGFIETEKRLPSTDEDSLKMELAILKTYKSALLSQKKINSLNK